MGSGSLKRVTLKSGVKVTQHAGFVWICYARLQRKSRDSFLNLSQYCKRVTAFIRHSHTYLPNNYPSSAPATRRGHGHPGRHAPVRGRSAAAPHPAGALQRARGGRAAHEGLQQPGRLRERVRRRRRLPDAGALQPLLRPGHRPVSGGGGGERGGRDEHGNK